MTRSRIYCFLSFFICAVIISCATSSSSRNSNTQDVQNPPPESQAGWACADSSSLKTFRSDVCDDSFGHHPRRVYLTVYDVTQQQMLNDQNRYNAYNSACNGKSVSEYKLFLDACSQALGNINTLWDNRADLRTGTNCGITSLDDIAAKQLCVFSGGSWNNGCSGISSNTCAFPEACHIGNNNDNNIWGFITCTGGDEETSQNTDLEKIIDCSAFTYSALDSCSSVEGVAFKDWIHYPTTEETHTYEDCATEHAKGICKSFTAPDTAYLYDSWTGKRVDTFFAECTTRTLLFSSDSRNPWNINQPDTTFEKVDVTDLVYYPRRILDTLPNCPRSQNLMGRVNRYGDTSWITPVEPLPCDAVLMCKSTRDSIDEARNVANKEKECADPTTGCKLFRLEGLEYLGNDKVYPHLATNNGDVGVVQGGPVYNKVVIPRNMPRKIVAKLRMGYKLAEIQNFASVVVASTFEFATHSSKGPVLSSTVTKDTIHITSSNLVSTQDGNLLFLDSVDMGMVPSTIGIFAGSIDFKLINIAGIWNDLLVRSGNDTLYITLGKPINSAYIYKDYRDIGRVATQYSIGDSIVTSVTNMRYFQFGVENVLTDQRLKTALGSFDPTLQTTYTPDVMDSLLSSIHRDLLNKVSPNCTFGVLADTSAGWAEKNKSLLEFYYNPSRIWGQFDKGGASGQCQEYTFAFDNILRTLGIPDSVVEFKPVQLYTRKDNCVGVKEYSIEDTTIIWQAPLNQDPFGFWVFAHGINGQEFYNSLLAQFNDGHSRIYAGYSMMQFNNAKEASEHSAFSNIKLIRKNLIVNDLDPRLNIPVLDSTGNSIVFNNSSHGGVSCSE